MSLAEHIHAQISPGEIGADLGFGLAASARLDPAPIRVEWLSARDGAPARADFFGLPDRLPFHEHALDYLVAARALEHAAHPAAAAAEWHRVVRPGGLVCVVEALRPAVLRTLLTQQPESQPRLLWEVAGITETPRATLTLLRVHKGWLARAQSEVFRLRAKGHPRAALRDDAQSFAEWAANTRG
ncbi:MAG: methyltransferase domain-containing protein [Opitutaceae bacterium]|nr:methyltransferase domain-containing protein [Opitutaceae bacterium]